MKNKNDLTKVEYVGEGYYHEFRNNDTKERAIEYITKEEYDSLGGKDGWKNNPTPQEGWFWYCSAGGSIKVDTPDGMLGLNQYTIKDNIYYVCELNPFNEAYLKEYSEEEFNKVWQ